jgi:hypothetical protein
MARNGDLPFPSSSWFSIDQELRYRSTIPSSTNPMWEFDKLVITDSCRYFTDYHTDIFVGESGAWTRASKVLEQLTANNSTRLGSSTLDYPVKNFLSDRRTKLPPIRQGPNRLQNVSFQYFQLASPFLSVTPSRSYLNSPPSNMHAALTRHSYWARWQPYNRKASIILVDQARHSKYIHDVSPYRRLSLPSSRPTVTGVRCQYNNTIHEILSYRCRTFQIHS